MKNKKVISAVLSALFVTMGINFSFSDAAVIEPEIVKTETWTTSYYIDDDIDTLYPYIDCQADIYNDGTVKCYFWNTHEWDGFATVSHRAIIINSVPVSENSREYAFKNQNAYYSTNGKNKEYAISKESYENKIQDPIEDYSFWQHQDISSNPKSYGVYECLSNFHKTGFSNNERYYFYSELGSRVSSCLLHYGYEGALPQMAVGEKSMVVFTPNVDPLDTYNIRFLGHDITVSPDILSSHIVATPQLTEQEKYIAELEQKNRELTEELERLKAEPSSILDDIDRLDANSDGKVDASDASIILSIYAYNSTNKVPITSLSEYFSIEQ
ncbi:hypothetical protein [Ruminococcus sp. XPD3002]|uniref:hypothetical protein n=1 Tax=Ruminococcus sp. XPD3002 TaxID=1452269 RepID=UPI00091FE26A|nr:hypothetical protein SAMN04487832_109138 [Ruminococcus flavefaciens]